MDVHDTMVAAIILYYDKFLGKYFHKSLRLYIPYVSYFMPVKLLN